MTFATRHFSALFAAATPTASADRGSPHSRGERHPWVSIQKKSLKIHLNQMLDFLGLTKKHPIFSNFQEFFAFPVLFIVYVSYSCIKNIYI
jgi:hypothetical protein